MKKTAKKWITGILSVLSLCAISLGVGSVQGSVEADAAVVYATNEITMEEGAQARKVGDVALRFTANISDATQAKIANGELTAGMIILPYSYMSRYYAQTEYTDYCEFFEKKGAPHFRFTYTGEHIQGVAGKYYIRGAVDNIQFLNLDRVFLAIAYIDDGTTKTYAPYLDSEGNTYVDFEANARSVAYVASGAITFSDDTTAALYDCVGRAALKEYGVTYDESTATYTYEGNSYTYEQLVGTYNPSTKEYDNAVLPLSTVMSDVYALRGWDFPWLFEGEQYDLQTEELADLKVKYAVEGDTRITVTNDGLVSAPVGVAGSGSRFTARVGNDTRDIFTHMTEPISVKARLVPTVEQMQSGVTVDWYNTYMAFGNEQGYRAQRVLLSDIGEAGTALAPYASGGAALHLTGANNWLYGLEKSCGNLLPNYTDTDGDGVKDTRNVYTFDFWYYSETDTKAYFIAMDERSTAAKNYNRTIRVLDFKQGLHKMTFEYEGLEADTEFVLNIYTNATNMSLYMGELNISLHQRAINRTDYYAPTNEEMLAEGGYTWDFLDGKLLQFSNANASYCSLSETASETAKKLVEYTRFNGYALKYAKTESTLGTDISFLTGNLTDGYTYILSFDAYREVVGGATVLTMNAAGSQGTTPQLDWVITDNGDGTYHYKVWFKADATKHNSIKLYFLDNSTVWWLANFNIAMEDREEVVTSGTFAVNDLDAFKQGTIVDTPTGAVGQAGFGEKAYRCKDRKDSYGNDDTSIDLQELTRLTRGEGLFTSIKLKIYYYVESAPNTNLYLTCDGVLDGRIVINSSTAGYGCTEFTVSVLKGIQYIGIYKDAGKSYGTFYIGSIDYEATTLREKTLMYAEAPYLTMTAQDGYTYDFSEGNALELTDNATYYKLSEMTDTALAATLLETGEFASGYALRWNGVGGADIATLNYNMIPGYTYTVSFRAYQVEKSGSLLLLPMGGMQNGSYTITQTQVSGNLYDYSVTFTAAENKSTLKARLYQTGACDLYISRFNIKATPPTGEEHQAVDIENGDYLVNNGEIALVENGGYANSNAICFKATSGVNAGLWLKTSYAAGERVHVFFRVNPKDSAKYASLKIYDDTGRIVDYAYPSNGWSSVNFDGTVVEKGGSNYVYVGLIGATGYDTYISEVSIDGNVTPTGSELLGGNKFIQINNQSKSQMQGQLIKTWDGKLIVIDGGTNMEKAVLAAQIRANATTGTDANGNTVYYVDAWFITHYHNDHVWALMDILSEAAYDDIIIRNLYYDFAEDAADGGYANSYSQKDNDYSSFAVPFVTDRVPNAMASGQIENRIAVPTVITAETSLLFESNAIKIKALNRAYYGASNTVNNSSVVYKIETYAEGGAQKESVLILGDLGNYGDTLMKDSYFLSEMKNCRVIQMAHHGQAGTTDAFYAAIEDIRVCIYAAPNWLYDVFSADLWQSSGEYGTGGWATFGTREIMREMGMRYSYSMKEGILTLG